MVVTGLSAAIVVGQAAASFQPGQKIEVREGDEWSAATVVKREGRRFQIKYDDGTEEWVPADRMRAAGAAGAGAAAPAGPGAPATPASPQAATPAAPAKPAPPALVVNIGDKVEVKCGGLWRDATVKNKGNGWTLVNYNGAFSEWVEPWRVRKVGSTTDVPYATPNQQLTKLGPPPTQPPGPKPQEESSRGGDDAVETELPIKEANVAAVKDLILGSDSAKWSLTPDPAPSKPLSPQPIVLKGGIDLHDRLSDLVFASASNVAAVVHTNAFKRKLGTLERIDLAGAAPATLFDFTVATAPLDLSPDGTMLLARSNRFGFGESRRLDLYNVASAQLQHVLSFVPYGDQRGSAGDIKWARFLDADHAATANSDGRVVVWDVKNARAIWAADTSAVTPALSGGAKQVAAVVEKWLVVVESATGRMLASLTLPNKVSFGVLSFRPDGKQIALASDGTLRVWDATTGALVSDAPYDTSSNTIDWASDGYVLLGGRTLLDLEQKMPLWQYKGAKATGTHAGRIWYLASQQVRDAKPVLASAVLPSDAVKRAAKSITPAEIWAAQPGASVSLDTGGLPGDIQEKSATALRSKLEANGFKVADSAEIRVVATVEAGQPQEISYRNFREGLRSEGTKVTATPQTMKVSFLDAEGNTLWQRQQTRAAPMMLSLKEGQSHDQAVSEATKPDANFYVNMTLPKFVPKAKYKNGLGTSEFGPRGVVDAKPQTAAQ